MPAALGAGDGGADGLLDIGFAVGIDTAEYSMAVDDATAVAADAVAETLFAAAVADDEATAAAVDAVAPAFSLVADALVQVEAAVAVPVADIANADDDPAVAECIPGLHVVASECATPRYWASARQSHQRLPETLCSHPPGMATEDP